VFLRILPQLPQAECKGFEAGRVDAGAAPLDNAAMNQPDSSGPARSQAVRRVKSYSAASGYVYQYYFHEVEKTRRGFAVGTDYVYMVSADRKTAFPVRVFVRADAVRDWGNKAGREMTGTEEYAVAKVRLFLGFDEAADPAGLPRELVVDATNLESLLNTLDL